ncbi:MAG TPA: hypothetical protein VNN55_04630, partial [bacterium]|nr:hypothetical protein [bacterium]
PACDSVPSDIQDVVKVINTAFRGDAPVADIYCPFERTDVTCDLRTDVLDVVGMVNVAFRGGDPESEFCLGCP